jgi:hypothetical protein
LEEEAEDDQETSGVETQSELKEQGHNWNSAEKLVPNQVRWRDFVNGLCSSAVQRAIKKKIVLSVL